MNDTQLSSRQKQILAVLQKNSKGLNRLQLEELLQKQDIDLSKVTLIRDLNELISAKYIKSQGVGKATKYVYNAHSLLAYFDLNTYFSKDLDQRGGFEKFYGELFELLDGLFTKEELLELKTLNQKYQKNIDSLSPDIYKKELERFIIELSWKSSKIEGNTYSLLETEALIKEAKQAEGHPQAEAQMILNHKKAFDVIISHKDSFKNLTMQNIYEVHQALTEKLNVEFGVRKNIVGIIGTKYTPLDNEWQIKEALETLLTISGKMKNPFEKAFLLVVGLSYLQAFADGNKRTARLVGNAVLLAYNWAPLSYRNIDEVEYKQALLLFYEQHSLLHFKRIFIDQFKFVVKNYFRS
jgi:hypothetical protein